MITSTTIVMRRFASTFFVFLALFVACAGVNAMPQVAADHDVTVAHAQHGFAADGVAADDFVADDQDPLPSLEDNNNGLDDTFDVPREHAVVVMRIVATRLPSLVPPPHAHQHSLELRPPIA